jgi:hypothetical protein
VWSVSQQNANLLCTQSVFVTVTMINRARSAVSVSGVRRQGTAVTPGCQPAGPFTYTPNVPSVGAGATEVLLSRVLYNGQSGCCNGRCPGTFCEYRETFSVLTSLGEVPAGAVGFGVTFRNCQPCSSSVSASESGLDCPQAEP